MIQCIRQILTFTGNLIGILLGIPVTQEIGVTETNPITIGIIIFIVILLSIGLKFLYGGKGD